MMTLEQIEQERKNLIGIVKDMTGKTKQIIQSFEDGCIDDDEMNRHRSKMQYQVGRVVHLMDILDTRKYVLLNGYIPNAVFEFKKIGNI